MSKFKVGDKVRRVRGCPWGGVEQGGTYTITGFNKFGALSVDSVGEEPKYYAAGNFELVKEDTSNYYKHYDLVIAWMQGKEVQFEDSNGVWISLSKLGERSNVPAFSEKICYRVKPEPCPKEVKLTSLVSKLEEQLKEAQEQLKEMRNE